MSPGMLLTTSALLGVFALSGGIFGTCYAAAAITGRAAYRIGAAAAYAMQLAALVLVLAITPLGLPWKALLVASMIAYSIVPSKTLKYLTRIHTGTGA